MSNPKTEHAEDLPGELSELKTHAECAATATERRRWQVLYLIALGKSRAEVGAATGYSLRTIRLILQRYRERGASGLVDGRSSRVTLALLILAQQQALREALRQPPPAGGEWSGTKVAEWMSTVTGQPVHRQRGWEYLRRFSP